MRRLAVLLLLVIVVLAVVGVAWSWLAQDSGAAVLVLAEVDGDVRIEGPGVAEAPARRGVVLAQDARLATGEDGRAVLASGPETRIRVGAASSVQVLAVDEAGVHLELEGGAVRATVRPNSGALRVSNRGREVLATDAEIGVGVTDGTFQAEVERGEALVRGVEGVGSLEAGQRVTALPDGGTRLAPIPEDLLLQVDWPSAPRTRAGYASVLGKTEPGARVRIHGHAGEVTVVADGDGRFEAEVALVEGDNDLVIEAVDPLGNSADVQGRMVRDTRGPAFRGGVEYGP